MRLGGFLVVASLPMVPVSLSLLHPVHNRVTSRCTADPEALGRAGVSCEDATEAALAAAGGGSVQSATLNEEHGLHYTFAISGPGAATVEEVEVDAITGNVIRHRTRVPGMGAEPGTGVEKVKE